MTVDGKITVDSGINTGAEITVFSGINTAPETVDGKITVVSGINETTVSPEIPEMLEIPEIKAGRKING